MGLALLLALAIATLFFLANSTVFSQSPFGELLQIFPYATPFFGVLFGFLLPLIIAEIIAMCFGYAKGYLSSATEPTSRIATALFLSSVVALIITYVLARATQNFVPTLIIGAVLYVAYNLFYNYKTQNFPKILNEYQTKIAKIVAFCLSFLLLTATIAVFAYTALSAEITAEKATFAQGWQNALYTLSSALAVAVFGVVLFAKSGEKPQFAEIVEDKSYCNVLFVLRILGMIFAIILCVFVQLYNTFTITPNENPITHYVLVNMPLLLPVAFFISGFLGALLLTVLVLNLVAFFRKKLVNANNVASVSVVLLICGVTLMACGVVCILFELFVVGFITLWLGSALFACYLLVYNYAIIDLDFVKALGKTACKTLFFAFAIMAFALIVWAVFTFVKICLTVSVVNGIVFDALGIRLTSVLMAISAPLAFIALGMAKSLSKTEQSGEKN